MSPRLLPVFLSAFFLTVAGCASSPKAVDTPDGTQPMEAPVDMNLAQAGQTAENPFAKSFVKRDLTGAAWQHDQQGPKVYRGEDQVNDYQRMLENGYDMLGYSEFFAGADVPPALLEQHAKAINADVALVYTKLSGEVPASVQVQQMREQARQGKTPDAAASKNSYTYYASYWGKLMQPLLGVHVVGPAEDQLADGLQVIAVINDSPADKAGIQNGDILKQLGDVPLDNPSALTQAARQYAGQKVEAQVQRGPKLARIPVQLNPLRTTASK